VQTKNVIDSDSFLIMKTKASSTKSAEWLAPLPEEEYLRIVYFGKLQIPGMNDDSDKHTVAKRLEEMIAEIWKVSSIWNSTHGISGHLAYTNELHVSQLIEGKAEEIISLMRNIRKDPRVVIHKEFRKKLHTMNLGWNISMCYTFHITTEQYRLIADDDVTPEQMFNSMKNSYEVRREGWKLNEFYKTIVDTFLLKYISIHEKMQMRSVTGKRSSRTLNRSQQQS